VPTKNPCPTPDEQTRNNPLSALRSPAEREGAMFKHLRALQRVSPGPATITTIMAAALVIITLRHDSRHESRRERLSLYLTNRARFVSMRRESSK